MSFSRFVIVRLLQTVPILLGISAVTFGLLYLVPGDPARSMLGMLASPQSVAALRASFGLDAPPVTRFVSFLAGAFHGNFGASIFYQVPVRALILDRASVSLQLIGFAVVIEVLVAIPAAVISALREGRLADQVIRAGSLVALGAPSAWLGLMLILVFAITWPILPVGGLGAGGLARLQSLVLPSLVLALPGIALLVRSLRTSLLDILGSDYVMVARAKGVSTPRLVMRHLLPNAVVPTLSILGVHVAALLGGTLVVEKVFAIQGVGGLLVDSIAHRDFAVIQGTTLVVAVLVLTVTFVVDVVVGIIDPRTRTEVAR